MPAQKKHSSVRRRTNKASTASVLEHAEDGEGFDLPDLPDRYLTTTRPNGEVLRQQVEWCAETLDWWEDVWASPMAAEYLDADVHGLIRLAALVDNYWRDPSAKTHAEVRLAQKDYGLTPYDRRRLEWTVEAAKKAKADGAKGSSGAAPLPPPAEPPDPSSDPRLHLVQSS